MRVCIVNINLWMFVYNTITEVWTAEIDKYVKLHPFRHVYTPSHPNFLNSVESVTTNNSQGQKYPL